MVKVRRKFATGPCMGIKMIDKSKKLLVDYLSLVGSDDKGIVIGFYDKRQGRGKGIRFCINS